MTLSICLNCEDRSGGLKGKPGKPAPELGPLEEGDRSNGIDGSLYRRISKDDILHGFERLLLACQTLGNKSELKKRHKLG